MLSRDLLRRSRPDLLRVAAEGLRPVVLRVDAHGEKPNWRRAAESLRRHALRIEGCPLQSARVTQLQEEFVDESPLSVRYPSSDPTNAVLGLRI